MRALQSRRESGEGWTSSGGSARFRKTLAGSVLAAAMVLSMTPAVAQAAEVNLTPGPTIIAASGAFAIVAGLVRRVRR